MRDVVEAPAPGSAGQEADVAMAPASGSAGPIAPMLKAPAPGSTGQAARGSADAPPEQPAPQAERPDTLKTLVDADFVEPKLVANLGFIEDVPGPWGEYAGYASIRTELWRATDKTHRFRCFLILLIPSRENARELLPCGA